MKHFVIVSILLFVVLNTQGQFRDATWGMSVNEVTKKESLDDTSAQFYDFKNGNQSIGLKRQLDMGSLSDLVYSNYHFIKNKLSSGSYVFYELDNQKIDDVIKDISDDYGSYNIYYGNQKLKRTIKVEANEDYRSYLQANNSLEIIWNEDKKTKVVLRIISTGTEIFGTWGWLSFYEDSYFRKSIEPAVIRSMANKSK